VTNGLRILWFISGLTLGFCLQSCEARAANQCASYAALVDVIKNKYGERIFGEGLATTEKIEVWISDERRTFTVLLVLPDGRACIKATGSRWITGNED